jgi:uncharacterized protein
MTLYENIYQRVFQMLETELPSFLTYHSPLHTAYVLEKAEVIAMNENVTIEEDLQLIKIAAMLHDIGFIKHYKNHEETGCDIASEILKELSFDKEDIEKVCGMIMATKIPQSPRTISEKIVADADLEYLGTELFNPISQLLFKELKYLDPDLDLSAFQKIQIDFLSNHHYHTDYCIQRREPLKQKHLAELREKL